MTQLNVCLRCDGFVPPTAGQCPNCETQTRTRKRISFARQLLQTAGGGAVAVTLMACYGIAPQFRQGAPHAGMACDQDLDGFCAPDDCDDNANRVHPGAPDPAGDGVDQNCDGNDGGFAEEPPQDSTEPPKPATLATE